MDANEYIKEAYRMCSRYHCDECPARKGACIVSMSVSSSEAERERYVSIVEKWSKEHPVITNREVFRKTFGDDQLHGIENIIENTRNEGIANALSAFLDREYEEIKGENNGIHEN